MEQRPQRAGVLGTRLASIDHDDSLTQLASVTTPILDLPDDASLHLIASYD